MTSSLLATVLLTGACKAQSTEPSTAAEPPIKVELASPKVGERVSDDAIVLKWSGGAASYGAVLKKYETTFREMETKHALERYRVERQAVDRFIVEHLVEAEAAKNKLSPDAYMEQVIGPPPPVSEDEIKKIYENDPEAKKTPYDAVRGQIHAYLQQQKQQQKAGAHIEELKKNAKIAISLPRPNVPPLKLDLTGRTFKGNPDAKVTLVEFSDFECPYCASALKEIREIFKAHKDDVKLYFVHFPLNFHKQAEPAAIASICADEQGQFWDYHDYLFAAQHDLGEPLYVSTAKLLKLDMEKFEQCRKADSTRKKLDADMQAAEANAVGGTPTIFVNGQLFPGGIPTVADIAQEL